MRGYALFWNQWQFLLCVIFVVWFQWQWINCKRNKTINGIRILPAFPPTHHSLLLLQIKNSHNYFKYLIGLNTILTLLYSHILNLLLCNWSMIQEHTSLYYWNSYIISMWEHDSHLKCSPLLIKLTHSLITHRQGLFWTWPMLRTDTAK